MSDIFISYSRENRDSVEKLAQALEAEGYSVWFDKNIRAGHDYDNEIKKQLDNSRCVIVLWSNESVSSRWVNSEAREGEARDVLIPILLDDIKPPSAFRRLQSINMAKWQGEKDKSLTLLLDNVHLVVGVPDARSKTPKNTRTIPWYLVASLVALPIFLITAYYVYSQPGSVTSAVPWAIYIFCGGILSIYMYKSFNSPLYVIHRLVRPLPPSCLAGKYKYAINAVAYALTGAAIYTLIIYCCKELFSVTGIWEVVVYIFSMLAVVGIVRLENYHNFSSYVGFFKYWLHDTAGIPSAGLIQFDKLSYLSIDTNSPIVTGYLNGMLNDLTGEKKRDDLDQNDLEHINNRSVIGGCWARLSFFVAVLERLPMSVWNNKSLQKSAQSLASLKADYIKLIDQIHLYKSNSIEDHKIDKLKQNIDVLLYETYKIIICLTFTSETKTKKVLNSLGLLSN